MPVLYEQAVRSYDYRFLDAKEAVISGWLRSRKELFFLMGSRGVLITLRLLIQISCVWCCLLDRISGYSATLFFFLKGSYFYIFTRIFLCTQPDYQSHSVQKHFFGQRAV